MVKAGLLARSKMSEQGDKIAMIIDLQMHNERGLQNSPRLRPTLIGDSLN